jgi:hypothetical protein
MLQGCRLELEIEASHCENTQASQCPSLESQLTDYGAASVLQSMASPLLNPFTPESSLEKLQPLAPVPGNASVGPLDPSIAQPELEYNGVKAGQSTLDMPQVLRTSLTPFRPMEKMIISPFANKPATRKVTLLAETTQAAFKNWTISQLGVFMTAYGR